jgi:heme A synthase
MIFYRLAARLAFLLIIVSLGSTVLGRLPRAPLASGMLTVASARAQVTLGDVTVSSESSDASQACPHPDLPRKSGGRDP